MKRSFVIGLIAAIVAGGVIPIAMYWFLFESVPSVTPDEAKVLLADTNALAVLVDVRSPKAFAAGHPPGAVNWPQEQAGTLAMIPNWPALKDSKILLVCDSGLSSAFATRRLMAQGFTKACNVSGGLTAWNTIAGGKCIALNARHPRGLEQWLAILTAFGIKPLYMLLSFLWIVWLWRQTAPDLVALKWGLIIFWFGENACSVNYLFFGGLSDLWEFLHNYGMAVGFSFIAWAVFEGVDHRLLKLSPPKERCAALSLCKVCIKYQEVPCGLQRVFQMLIPAMLVIAAMPLFAEIKVLSYNAHVLGSLQNYALMASSQLFENRFGPVLAMSCFALSWLALVFKKHHPLPWSKILFAAGLGPMSFGMMRLFLSSAYADDLLWYVAWEEWTELVFVLAVGYVLWLFRRSLFISSSSASVPTGT